MRSTLFIRGGVEYWLIDPDGGIAQHGYSHNIVTATGDRMYLERGAGLPGAPNAPTGMRLGTTTTQPSKTGAGAAIGAYVNGSAGAFDTGYPVAGYFGDARRVTYARTWPAGVATSAAYITEVVLTIESPPSEYPGTEADTVARVLLHPPVTKAVGQGLVVAWHHDSLGT